MNLLYYARVFFISDEFLAVLVGYAIFLIWGDSISRFFNENLFNAEAVRYFVLLPIAITAWILKEGLKVLFPSETASKTLQDWPDYPKLKVHFWVGVITSILLAFFCLLIWLFDKLDSFEGAWFFGVFVIALMLNAFSFYSAIVELKTILARSGHRNGGPGET